MKIEDKGRRIVISGTYSTGKTTTTTALSIATGIPMVNSLSAREILTDLYPGRRFQDMTADELMALGLKRFEERIKAEERLLSKNSSFISDGSVLNEWIYGTVRMKVGINPGSTLPHRIAKNILGITSKPFMKKYLQSYGVVVNEHAKKWYTDVIHLPIEFPMSPDGHRPVSEKYRKLSDQEILRSFNNIKLTPYIVKGSIEKRLKTIIDHFSLSQVIPVDEAIELAKEKIINNREMVSQHIIDQYHEPTLKEKIKIMTKY
ncbi:AAA family ATPase [Lactobacillus sp. ESL0679]|uniref:AAA family ATPase n=1 Tax=Lactobacillus sp. ESL0679 TaxID=2983209 RepID=UPI0023F8D479|nr:AAA family ATPase [Lactobacillus sp. ESL0679]MDF7682204.1 AAA family ATPase [Lactobacillus sp. ESL0679]